MKRARCSNDSVTIELRLRMEGPASAGHSSSLFMKSSAAIVDAPTQIATVLMHDARFALGNRVLDIQHLYFTSEERLWASRARDLAFAKRMLASETPVFR